MESGQMVIDKKQHLDVMLLVRYMMEHHDFVRILAKIKVYRHSWTSGSDSLMGIRTFSALLSSPFENDGVYPDDGSRPPDFHVEPCLAISAVTLCFNTMPLVNQCLSTTTSSNRSLQALEKGSRGEG